MIKNRSIQLIYQTVYIVLGVIGFIHSLGYFSQSFNFDFYLYYTNLSNYICLGIMIAIFVSTIKSANKKEDGFVQVAPKFKLMCVIMILVTCLVYNFLLARENGVYNYFMSIGNLTNHLILPIMFVLDWVLFYEHGKVKWYYPLLCTIMPLIYVAFIIIRALIINATIGVGYSGLLYPYFFLDASTLGWGGVIGWVFALLIIFIAIGYIFYAFDNLKRWKENRKAKNITKE